MITIDTDGNIKGLTKAQIDSLIISLRTQAQGYDYLKQQSFSQQKTTWLQLQPELAKLSNSEFRKVVEAQLQQCKDCKDLLVVLETWKKEQN